MGKVEIFYVLLWWLYKFIELNAIMHEFLSYFKNFTYIKIFD